MGWFSSGIFLAKGWIEEEKMRTSSPILSDSRLLVFRRQIATSLPERVKRSQKRFCATIAHWVGGGKAVVTLDLSLPRIATHHSL